MQYGSFYRLRSRRIDNTLCIEVGKKSGEGTFLQARSCRRGLIRTVLDYCALVAA